MPGESPDVTRYLQQVPDERRANLTALRQLCLEILSDYEEVLEYGMPGYKKDGTLEVGFASQKNYISLYILKEPVMGAHREELAGLSLGKGCIRYSKPEKMDFAVIRKLLVATRDSPAAVC